jgi:SAM-dependent methyltransferase
MPDQTTGNRQKPCCITCRPHNLTSRTSQRNSHFKAQVIPKNDDGHFVQEGALRHRIIALLQALRLLPQAQKVRMLASTLSPTTLVHNFHFWIGGSNETLPIPGYWARLLVAGSADIPGFLELGRRGFDCIRETLERNGTPIGGLKDILDFGCGCGRVIRYWNGFADTRICGTDISEYLIETCQRCVPFASISKNSMVAMLDYANQSFDLVYAFSVFTHLDINAQKAWRDELRRILRPRGILLLTVHGNAYTGRLTGKEQEDFNSGRPVVRLGQYPGGNLCVSFHPESYVRETLAEGFEIVDAVPEGAKGNPVQDLYVLRRAD